ncbi:hypothetical protein TNCV_4687781 [Trichonephila clavipes]|nr:hypothetical protein TNCV_4687781 [Trichonephila clavipes]
MSISKMQQQQQFQHKKNSLRKISTSKCKKIYISSSNRLVFLSIGPHGLLVTDSWSRTPGSQTPGSQTPGSQTPGHERQSTS